MDAARVPVALIMGSQSDWAVMHHAATTLDALGVGYDARIVSAHRTRRTGWPPLPRARGMPAFR